MSRLFAALIRHGDYHQLPDTPSAHQPFPLTSKGFSQAKALAPLIVKQCEKLHCQVHPVVSSSRLLRGWQTAVTLVDELNDPSISVQQYDELAERSVGSVANLSIGQITELVNQDPRFEPLTKAWKANSHFCLPFQGAESLLDAGQRVANHLTIEMQQLQQSLNSENNQLKIFVGHGAAFRHAAFHLGLLDYEQIAQLSMFHCQPIFVEFNSKGAWQHVAGDWKVRSKYSKFTD